jgi:beta-glucosidase
MVTHGFCADRREAAREAVKAGVDMEMVSTSYSDHLEELVARGEVPIAVIDTAVSRILRIKARLGLFDHPRVDLGRKAVLLSREHLAVARELATQSLVLLKNDGGLLPLRKDLRSIAVIGPLADSPADQMGCWTFDGKPEDVRTPLSAIREAVSAATQVCHAPGLSSDRSSDTSGFEEAVRATRGAEAAVVFVGESAGLSGEAHCRAFLDLPGAQQQLVEAIHATGTPTVVVVMAGRPLTINWVAEHVPAVLMAWHPGTMGGSAIADLLFGDAAPSGKLPVSFPRTVGQIPIHYNHKNTGRPPVKRDRKAPMGTPLDPVGFCSHYLDVDETPQFPFGYGLSFTSFEYSDIQVSPPTIRLGESVQVSAKVANTGARPGVETAQLYVRDLAASVTRPVKELRGFQRVALSPGESRRLEFRLHTDDVRFYDRNMRFVAEPGAFRVWIGTDSDSGVSAEFRVQ